MKARLACPGGCGQRLWVEIATAGGHHTEAWPAHECVRSAAAEAQAPAPTPVESGRGRWVRRLVERICETCGASMLAKPGRARWCAVCSAERRRESRRRAQRKYLPMRPERRA